MGTSIKSQLLERSPVGRVAALQPAITADDLLTVRDVSKQPLVISHLEHVIRLWARERTELAEDFEEVFQIQEVKRQAVAFALADVQSVRRTIRPIEEPFRGTSINTSEWPIDDPFQMRPFDPIQFPEQPIVEEWPIPGREAVRVCDDCSGATERQCEKCAGLRTVNCEKCDGGSVQCKTCNGDGRLLKGGQSLINCPDCKLGPAPGRVKCRTCDKDGHVKCMDCRGKGTSQCKRCEGRGQLKTYSVLVTNTSTKTEAQTIAAVKWLPDAAALLPESDQLWRNHAALPLIEPVNSLLDRALRHELRHSLEHVLSTTLDQNSQTRTSEQRATGIQGRVHSTYLYFVTFDYKGQEGNIVVGGPNNHVFAVSAPRHRRRLIDTAMKHLGGFFTRIGMPPEHSGLDDRYVDSVKCAKAYLADTRLIVSDAAARIGAVLRVTERGYGLDVSVERGAAGLSDVHIDVAFDADTVGQSVVVTTLSLGVAHRDRYAAALGYNHFIIIGRIGVLHCERGDRIFVLVDSQPYELLSIDRYEFYLAVLLHEREELLVKGVLS